MRRRRGLSEALCVPFTVHYQLECGTFLPTVFAMVTKRDILDGRVLRDVRELNGVTQEEVARALGRSQSFVSKSETGERALKVGELFQFAKVLGLEPEQLVSLMREAVDEQEAIAAHDKRAALVFEHWDDLPWDSDEQL